MVHQCTAGLIVGVGLAQGQWCKLLLLSSPPDGFLFFSVSVTVEVDKKEEGVAVNCERVHCCAPVAFNCLWFALALW